MDTESRESFSATSHRRPKTITAENFGSYIFFTPKTQPSVVSGNEFAGGIPAK